MHAAESAAKNSMASEAAEGVFIGGRIDIQADKALSSDTNKENKKRFATIIELGTPHRPHVMITASDSHYTTRVQSYMRPT